MTPPSLTDHADASDITGDVTPFAQLLALSHALAGTLRKTSVVDLLFRHIRQALSPAEISLALVPGDADTLGPARTWPSDAPDRQAVLEAVRHHGAPMLAHSPRFDDSPPPTTGLQSVLSLDPVGYRGSWLAVPFLAKDKVTGALAVRGEAGRYHARDLALLEGFVSVTNVALESTRLIDLYGDGRRSWQDVVDAISPALCVVDQAGNIRRANQAFAALVDASPAALIGRPWPAFMPPEWAVDLQGALDQQGTRREVELRTGDRTFVVTAAPISATDSSAIVLLFDDHTERRRLQDQLIQSEKMSAIGQLIAGVAHDLNNPLASVVGFADFLVEVPNVPPNLREPLTVIQEEAERASGIVKNLLGFARKQERQRRPTDLTTLLGTTFVLLRNQLMAQGVSYRVEIDPDLPAPLIDPNQMQQVFVNLITNAAHAIASTGRSGTVVVRARRWLDDIAVDVIDDGPGLPDALAAQVFEPFFTTKPEGQGTGLGLSISQGIVKEHGGRIMLATEEGKGCTFTVQLPLGAAAPPPLPDRLETTTARRLRVLVVDDEPHILHYMRATLEAWGHTAVVANDGDAALAIAARERFDLVISDLRMPKVGGRAFYEALQRQDPALADRLVFSTGDTVHGDTLTFLESLGRPYLHKPFSLGELRRLLGTALA